MFGEETNVTCTHELYGHAFDPEGTYRNCQTRDEEVVSFGAVFPLLQKILNQNTCKPRCSRSKFALTKIEYHKNIMETVNSFRIYFYYGSMSVEEKMEQLVHGLDGALVAIGGSMGLILGYSCLSISLWLLDTLEKKLQ